MQDKNNKYRKNETLTGDLNTNPKWSVGEELMNSVNRNQKQILSNVQLLSLIEKIIHFKANNSLILNIFMIANFFNIANRKLEKLQELQEIKNMMQLSTLTQH